MLRKLKNDMKIWNITDAAGIPLNNMSMSFDRLPSALPWIEPSINCLHQESVVSLMVGNAECAILSICALLEHTLRLAVINKEECGLIRSESISKIDQFGSLSAVIDIAAGLDIFVGCDESWWRAISKNIRNKSAHYLLPTIMKNCATEPKLKHYISEYELPENNNKEYYDKYIALKIFETANPKVIDKLRFVLKYIADENHPLCEPYVKHSSTAKYSLFYELRIKAAKEMVRVIFYLSNNDIVLLYSFCKQDKRDTDRCLKAAYRMFESGVFTKSEVCI